MASSIDHRVAFAVAFLVISLLVTGCSGGDGSGGSQPTVNEPGGGFDTLADGSWPTESMSSEAGATKKAFFASLTTGSLDDETAAEIFSPAFRGEDFAGRPGPARIASGFALADWQAAPKELDAAAFTERWNVYLAGFAEIRDVERHTWEIQLRPGAGGLPGIETHEAVWILGRLEDGRLREDRYYLVLDLEKNADGEWRIGGVGAEGARTTIGPGPYFHDVTAQVIPPGYDQIGAQIYTDGGPVLADFDDDGDVDLFLPRIHAPARLYENDGDGYFDDATALRGLELVTLAEGTNSGLFLDVDRDGDLDLAVGSKAHGLLLFTNDGDAFRDAGTAAAGAGEWESIAAADYDGDGFADVYMTSYNVIDTEHQPESYVDARDGQPNVLLRNTGGTGFEDVTEATGLAVGRERWSYAATWADYDRDGDMDLYVANDYGPNNLYRNRGDGTFDEVTEAVGAEDHGNGMAVSWADLDGDLWLDLYVSNMQSFAGNRITRLESFPGTSEQQALYQRFAKGNTLLKNQGDGTFSDATSEAGVKGAFWAWGNLAFDYDADRDLDLFSCGGFYTGAAAKDT